MNNNEIDNEIDEHGRRNRLKASSSSSSSSSFPWQLVTCDCPLFAQSRQLRYSITGEWMTALFNELTAQPRDMIYSIAFALTFLPLHGLTGREVRDDADASQFIAARELYDLLDDSLRLNDDEGMSFDQMLKSRTVSLDTFLQTNQAYIRRIEAQRELSNRLEVRDRERRSIDKSTMVAQQQQQPSSNNTHQATSAAAAAAAAAIEFEFNDEIEIRRVLQTLNDETCLPLSLNIVCSRVTKTLNVDALVDSIIHRNGGGGGGGGGDQSSRRVVVVVDSSDIKSSVNNSERTSSSSSSSSSSSTRRLSEKFSPEHMFLRYAPVVYRYETLLPVIKEIERTRDVRIRPIYLPQMSVWQTGSSQLLWIMMHTLAALSVERRNVYIMRFMVLLRNLSFFVWCGECAAHWENNHGDEFFAQLDRLAESTKYRLPIDLVLMRVHNQIAFNTNRTLSSWTLGQLVLDYREFVRRALTKPPASMCNRPHVSAWWKRRRRRLRQWPRSSQSPPPPPPRLPIFNEDQLGPRLIVRDDRERLRAYDRETYEPFYVRDESPLELVDSLVAFSAEETTSSTAKSAFIDNDHNGEIIKRSLGDWLLCTLWRSVSDNAPIGGTI